MSVATRAALGLGAARALVDPGSGRFEEGRGQRIPSGHVRTPAQRAVDGERVTEGSSHLLPLRLTERIFRQPIKFLSRIAPRVLAFAGTGCGPRIAVQRRPMVRASTALFLCGAALRPESRSLAEAAPQLPPVLTLKAARALFRERGLDLMLAEANVVSAEGDFAAAGALPNPGVSLSASKSFGCMSSQDCNTKTYSIGLADNDLISNFVTGKRGLRKDFAGTALDAARRSRDDARRTLEFMLEQTFYQALLAS